MRFMAALVVFWLAGCAPMPAPDLDPLAQAYVRLALEMNKLEDGYVDAYTGPPEWREEINATPPRSTADLKAVADELAAQLGAVATRDPEASRRLSFLKASVASARFRLDMIDGIRIPFRDEAERLFALRPDGRPLESYDPILTRIEALAPGPGPLSERVAAFDRRYEIPLDRLRAVMDAAIAECRARTLAHIDLPADESFSMEFVTGKSWGAYNWYQGNQRSLIQINTDLPIGIGEAIGTGCHEGYPGHHLQGMNNERLYRVRGWVEYSVAPLYNPSSPLAEGAGNYGVDLAFPGAERAEFEARVLFPLAGLDPALAPALAEMRAATEGLAGVSLTIAAMYLDGEITREQAIGMTQRYSLVSRARAEESVDFVDQYRSYVVNYSAGEDLVRAFVERAGTNAAARWAAFESIMTQPTLPSDLSQ